MYKPDFLLSLPSFLSLCLSVSWKLTARDCIKSGANSLEFRELGVRKFRVLIATVPPSQVTVLAVTVFVYQYIHFQFRHLLYLG